MKVLSILILIITISYVSCELDRDTSIVIVGAGAAGISALSKLLENGYTNIVLLEASDRIGGRIYTTPFAANVVDLGAQWVHGQKGNIIYEMVTGHNLLDVTPPSDFVGWLLSSESEKPNDYVELNTIAENILATRDDVCDDTKQPGSFGDYFMKYYKYELAKPGNQHISQNNSNDFVRYYEQMFNFDDASDSWFKTLLCSGYIRLEGENNLNWMNRGFKTIFDFITRKYPDSSKDLKVENKILFKKEVTVINWAHDTVAVHVADGSQYAAKHVIVTVPLGVLKAKHRQLFNPTLPFNKINSIEAIQFGTLNKIFMEFDRPFWPVGWLGFNLVWTQKGLRELENSRQHSWTKGMFGLWTMPFQPNTLSAWIVGPDARAMESLTDSQILDGVMYVFKVFLGDRMNYTRPKKMLPSRWNSNPYFRGSYSSQVVDTYNRNASPSVLALPINNTLGIPKILFAGEATIPDLYSAAHGAVQSGYREAERLMNL